MSRNKTQIYMVDDGEYKRLMKGTLRQVQNKLLSEIDVEPCSVEDARTYAHLAIEDVTGEP